MTDVILIATIVAFFVAAALLVRVLDHMIAGSGSDTDRDPDSDDQVSEPGIDSGRLT
jgi:hypothetical protein